MDKTYLIVGQGLAGTLLSFEFRKRGVPHRVLDSPVLSQSSRIAAGLANPIVLKRLKWVRQAEEYLHKALPTYRSLENLLSQSLVREITLKHLFRSPGEINDWQALSTQKLFKEHLGSTSKAIPQYIKAPYGFGNLENVFWLDTAKLISAYRNLLRQEQLLIEDQWQPGDHYQDYEIILAQGHQIRALRPELAECFRPSRGELLMIESAALDDSDCWHAGVFILPHGDGRFKVGASYHHDYFEDQPSEAGQSFLESKLQDMFQEPYKVLEHWAGVRPNTKDRQPLLGSFKDYHIFSGTGSRGVLAGPYLARRMADYLLEQKALPEALNISRFI